jgi:non-specific protein-tyrosine kinase
MTLEQFWSILLKQWRLVLLCLLLVGSGAFISSKQMTPVYQSSVLIEVVTHSTSSNQVDYNALLAGGQLLQTEATLATNESVLRLVVPHYPGLTTSELAAEVSASPRLNTQFFEIDVVDPSPTRAASLANDIAVALIHLQQQRTQQSNALARQQIQGNIDQINQQISSTITKISALQANGRDQGRLTLLQTQLSGLQQRFNQWQTTLVQLEVTQAQSENLLQIAQRAQPSSRPVRPEVALYTAGGLLVGLLLGVLLALLYEQLNTQLRTPEAISRLLEWPVLGTIWRTKTSNLEEIVNPTGQDVNAEAYRILRANIGFASSGKPLHSILITSSSPREGKSSVAANLAIFMAKAGKNTLLIDADLRHPTQHVLFGLSNDKLGLSNAVLTLSKSVESNAASFHEFFSRPAVIQMPEKPTTTNLSLEHFVHTVSIPNLWVMPSGPLPPNPAELLESKMMQQFLAEIANAGVEVIIFDAPSLLGLSDVSILASKVDGVLVVVDTMHATKSKLKQAKAVLAQTGACVIGSIANKQRPNRGVPSSYTSSTGKHSGEEQYRGERDTPAVPAAAVLSEHSGGV